jgi:hypothetical protein
MPGGQGTLVALLGTVVTYLVVLLTVPESENPTCNCNVTLLAANNTLSVSSVSTP